MRKGRGSTQLLLVRLTCKSLEGDVISLDVLLELRLALEIEAALLAVELALVLVGLQMRHELARHGRVIRLVAARRQPERAQALRAVQLVRSVVSFLKYGKSLYRDVDFRQSIAHCSLNFLSYNILVLYFL